MHICIQTDRSIEDLCKKDQKHQVNLLTGEVAKKALHAVEQQTDGDFIENKSEAEIGHPIQQSPDKQQNLMQEENIAGTDMNCREESNIFLIQRIARDVWFDATKNAIEVHCNPRS